MNYGVQVIYKMTDFVGVSLSWKIFKSQCLILYSFLVCTVISKHVFPFWHDDQVGLRRMFSLYFFP